MGATARSWRPAENQTPSVPDFTAGISLEPAGGGTKYRAVAVHADEGGRTRHDAMGFQEGWGAALDQLVTAAKALQTR